jgi:hypothetical protein
VIISKASLQLANLCDKRFSSICIEPDGSVVVFNGTIIAVCSPVRLEIKKNVPIEEQESENKQIILNSETVFSIIKSMPRDTLFKGLLEHCDMSLPDDGSPIVKVITTDGKQKAEIIVRRIQKHYFDYKKILRDAFIKTSSNILSNKKILNRKRWKDIVEVIDKVCPYAGDFSPVFWEFNKNDIVVRSINELTGQRMIAYFKAVEKGEWLVESNWEKKLLYSQY